MLTVPLLLPLQVGVTAALLTTVVGMISVSQTWGEEWDIIAISLQVRTPPKIMNRALPASINYSRVLHTVEWLKQWPCLLTAFKGTESWLGLHRKCAF